MKEERDELAMQASELLRWVHEQDGSPDTSLFEAAVYNVYEAERTYEGWMQRVMWMVREVATGARLKQMWAENRKMLWTDLTNLRDAADNAEETHTLPALGRNPYR